ncbi:hypothetical protein PK28_00415 [Hymenobacter sp. DG25B]|uniref:hypothetical protein n=1 Tax=Hymenobacter sp. DG25B TaxID=1385664 RepID=UPI000540F67E|nr:hypothetical protein [Hymenobacter sp. DG25B]AIZ62537.1 hypothetical protein PK28_00415 [Hymenobacter sp. DG25B]
MQRFLLFLFLLMPALTQAQDVILRTSGEELPAKVVRITPDQVVYMTGTDTLQLPATEVFLIRYANGTKEVLGNKAVATTTVPALTPQQAEQLGRSDARQLFKAKGAFWGTCGATFITMSAYGLGGVATGAAIAATPPKDKNLIPSRPELLQNPDYVRGYKQQAQNKKLGKAAAGFGVGAGAALVVVSVAVIVALTQWQ